MERFLKCLSVLLGVVLLVNVIYTAFTENLNVGVIPLILVSAFLIFNGFYFKKNKKKYSVVVSVLFLAGISVFVALGLYGNRDTSDYKENAVIVLGCGISGEEISDKLANRLDEAVLYHKKTPDALIVVSGGQGPQESITEAQAMERYLTEKGVNPEVIIKEEKSTSTEENFLYSKEILDERFSEEYSVAFITNDYHIFRAEKIAQQQGINVTHIGAPVRWYTAPINYSREILAIISFFVL